MTKNRIYSALVIIALCVAVFVCYKETFKPRSFSQYGEDLIVKEIIVDVLKKEKITYLDVGARHSEIDSNTKLFYDEGSSGVLVEPNPELFDEIKRNRGRDICLNVGVGISDETEADLYVMDNPGLSTFSKKQAELVVDRKWSFIKQTIKVELVAINEIMRRYFPNENELDFLSIDTEGLDLDILKTLDFGKYRPKIVCVETNAVGSIDSKNINELLTKNGYYIYYNNDVNTIFVDSAIS